MASKITDVMISETAGLHLYGWQKYIEYSTEDSHMSEPFVVQVNPLFSLQIAFSKQGSL